MHKLLTTQRDELAACVANVAQRPIRAATATQLANRLPLLLGHGR